KELRAGHPIADRHAATARLLIAALDAFPGEVDDLPVLADDVCPSPRRGPALPARRCLGLGGRGDLLAGGFLAPAGPAAVAARALWRVGGLAAGRLAGYEQVLDLVGRNALLDPLLPDRVHRLNAALLRERPEFPAGKRSLALVPEPVVP